MDKSAKLSLVLPEHETGKVLAATVLHLTQSCASSTGEAFKNYPCVAFA